jgi:hypothetical protein
MQYDDMTYIARAKELVLMAWGTKELPEPSELKIIQCTWTPSYWQVLVTIDGKYSFRYPDIHLSVTYDGKKGETTVKAFEMVGNPMVVKDGE